MGFGMIRDMRQFYSNIWVHLAIRRVKLYRLRTRSKVKFPRNGSVQTLTANSYAGVSSEHTRIPVAAIRTQLANQPNGQCVRALCLLCSRRPASTTQFHSYVRPECSFWLGIHYTEWPGMSGSQDQLLTAQLRPTSPEQKFLGFCTSNLAQQGFVSRTTMLQQLKSGKLTLSNEGVGNNYGRAALSLLAQLVPSIWDQGGY